MSSDHKYRVTFEGHEGKSIREALQALHDRHIKVSELQPFLMHLGIMHYATLAIDTAKTEQQRDKFRAIATLHRMYIKRHQAKLIQRMKETIGVDFIFVAGQEQEGDNETTDKQSG